MLLRKRKNTRSFRDDVSSAASSDTGSEYIVSDSDMDPEELESKTEDLPEPEKKKDDKLRWFQATTTDQLACSYLLPSFCSFCSWFITFLKNLRQLNFFLVLS